MCDLSERKDDIKEKNNSKNDEKNRKKDLFFLIVQEYFICIVAYVGI